MDLEYVNLSELADAEVVAHMRKMNYEQFKRLVRMHLSFELDLNTDEFDLPCHEIVYEDKGKLKKWNRMSKKHKHATTSATTGCATSSKGGAASADNSPTESLQQQIDAGFMFHLNELKEFLLLEKNLTQEGIFRKTGSVSRQNELRMKIHNDKPLELEDGGYSTHDCATVFKGYLAELPEPLLTDAHYPAHLQIAPLCMLTSATAPTKGAPLDRLKREQHLLHSVQLLLLLLPDDNRQLLQHIIEMLHAVVAYQHINKMSPENLATLFAPHLICPRKLPPEALHYVAKRMASIIAYMVVKGDEIFAVPAKLSTDIRAYFLERKRKKTMSPEQALDDSISDMSTVNTVYTFVDREKTAAAHTANTTDTELAQLYAHIQSMPESSKKRRLIKQFNKQNGQGTPLQLVVMNRLKNSEATRSAKSIGDSIKKHIFHKGIMSRTPKRPTAAVPVGVETPNFSNTKNPKLRVLFQSPVAPPTPMTVGMPSTPTSSSSLSTSSANTHTHTHTPYAIKSHPLQKSISSSSLLSRASSASSMRALHAQFVGAPEDHDASSSCSSDGACSQTSKAVSAPVSRQASSDMHAANASYTSTTSVPASSAGHAAHPFHGVEPNCCVTPLKLITAAAKQLVAAGVGTDAGTGGFVAGGGGGDKKFVAWDEERLLATDDDDDDEDDDVDYSVPSTPIQRNRQLEAQQAASDLKSRFKSEPNLSRILNEKDVVIASRDDAHAEAHTPNATRAQSLRRKLIKGVSMGNLKFPHFSTPDPTRRLVRSVSSTLKQRRASDEPQLHGAYVRGGLAAAETAAPLLEADADQLVDLDDDTFEDDPHDNLGSDDGGESTLSEGNDHGNEDTDGDEFDGPPADGGSSSSELPGCSSGGHNSLRSHHHHHYQQQHSGLYRNLDLVTSTPSLLLGRRSMSPITKSTQRMPKAMQESIMTPRSRKPVMVLTTTTSTLSSTDHNQTIYQTDLSSFREQDEEDLLLVNENLAGAPPTVHNENATSLGGYADILRRQHLLQTNQSFVQQASDVVAGNNDDDNDDHNDDNRGNVDANDIGTANELTNNFKDYLRSRSVLTASPVDLSFSSQPDDFGSSTNELDELAETQLSRSLLYCLDGNQPDVLEEKATAAANDRSTESAAQPAIKSKNGGGGVGDASTSPVLASSNHRNNRLATNPFVILNNARKRAASSDLTKNSPNRSPLSPSTTSTTTTINFNSRTSISSTTMTNTSPPRSATSAASRVHGTTATTTTTAGGNKENCDNVQGYLLSKKLLISEYPGETSF